MIELKFYVDPGHGWVAVKRHLLERLELTDKISSYSYEKGETVYLEEDCDASLLLSELDKRGIKYNVKEIYKEVTPIRNYERFAA